MLINYLITLLVAIAGWLIAKQLKLPAAAMIGSMLIVGITNVIFNYASFPYYAKIIAQSISGAFIGLQVTKNDLLNFKFLLKPFLILITILTINTIFTGTIIHFITGLDIITTMLGSVAGGVSDISLLSIDLGANTPIVALMQTMRLVGVLLLFPAWIKFMTKDQDDSQIDERMVRGTTDNKSFLDKYLDTKLKKEIFTVVVCLAVGYLGYLSPVPAGAMVFAIIASMIMNITTNVGYVSKNLKVVAQLVSGAVVGSSVTSSIVKELNLRTILAIIILLINYWIVNYLFSLYCSKKNYLDMKSAMLASAPGGATDMALIAMDLNADLAKIALIQVFRAVYAVSLMPTIIILIAKLLQ